MDLNQTLALLGAAALLALIARWGDGRRRRDPHGALALLPWHGLMFIALVAMLFLAAHLLTLSGARN